MTRAHLVFACVEDRIITASSFVSEALSLAACDAEIKPQQFGSHKYRRTTGHEGRKKWLQFR